jgi:ATP-binding cassette subfamily B (MDR/TAP) protein 1
VSSLEKMRWLTRQTEKHEARAIFLARAACVWIARRVFASWIQVKDESFIRSQHRRYPWEPHIEENTNIATDAIDRQTTFHAIIMSRNDGMPPSELRIACLIPSATSICLALGLRNFLVGVTHECEEELLRQGDNSTENSNHSSSSSIRVLTRDGLTAGSSQGEIHQAVQEASAGGSCSTKEIPSLYPIMQEELELAKPTIIFTQDLCAVCAPTSADVRKCLLLSQNNNNDEETTAKVNFVSLQPTNLHQVADNFVTVAEACGVLDRGLALKEQWTKNFSLLQTTIQQYRDVNKPPPRMLILEWLDPYFDSGHWTYQMMDYACVQMAKPKKEHKSKPMEWKEIQEMDPDVVVVGCCGFDLERNVQDTMAHQHQLASLRAAKENKIFACNGNIYIVQPGPALIQGAAVLAQCAYHDQPGVLEAIAKLNLIPPSEGWQPVNVSDTNSHSRTTETPKDPSIMDIEDLDGLIEDDGFSQLHQKSCQEGKMTYEDPETGYQVFTELRHKQRGYCCGSGCRHCPFGHENVKEKTSRIQQPAILHRQESNSLLFSLNHPNVKVLFFSGGKDSFLTIRAMVQSYEKESPFGLVLLTTFDASKRMVAHQDVSIDQIVRQAAHLDITLVGVPLRRASGEPYVDRIQRGLQVIQATLPENSRVTTLVFGDLHLEHIRSWRDKTMGDLGYGLEYPLWQKSYEDLMDGLEKSQVPCRVSATTVDTVQVGSLFNRQFYNQAIADKVDGFGECGEFHSLAQVWEVSRTIALGCDSSSSTS